MSSCGKIRCWGNYWRGKKSWRSRWRQEHAQPAGAEHRHAGPLKITYWKQSVDELMVDVFLEAHTAAPEQIVLDVDTTDVALHGDQEGRFFHGYYDHYCYLPLYIFSGEHLLCARLRQANTDAAAGAPTEIRRIVEQMRETGDCASRYAAIQFLPRRADELV